MSSAKIVSINNGLPANNVKTIPGGSIRNAVINQQNLLAEHQNNLGKTGGFKQKQKQKGKTKNKWKKGGAVAVAKVPDLPSYAVDKGGSLNNNIAITKLANQVAVSKAYDGTVNGGTQSDVNNIHKNQVTMLTGKGGGRKRKQTGKRRQRQTGKKSRRTLKRWRK